jgi:hypothetical protein
VDLGGYCLTDDPENLKKFTLTPGVTIPARGFLLLWADEQTSQAALTGQPHLNFKLSREGEKIVLSGPSGRVLDSILFGTQQADVSEGRVIDGDTSGFQRLVNASPGVKTAPPARARSLLWTVRRTQRAFG